MIRVMGEITTFNAFSRRPYQPAAFLCPMADVISAKKSNRPSWAIFFNAHLKR